MKPQLPVDDRTAIHEQPTTTTHQQLTEDGHVHAEATPADAAITVASLAGVIPLAVIDPAVVATVGAVLIGLGILAAAPMLAVAAVLWVLATIA